MKKREFLTATSLVFSIGIIIGFLISPAKNGIGNNIGNTVNKYYGKKTSTDNQ